MHIRLLISLVLGILGGILLHPYADNAQLIFFNTHILNPIGQIFLKLIFMIVIPMVFSALVLGTYELVKNAGLGATMWRTLKYTILTSACSVLIGITLVNVFKPGWGISIDTKLITESAKNIEAIKNNAASTKSFSQIVVDLIPKNPLDAAVRAFDGEMIAFMVFTLLFGVAIGLLHRERKEAGEALIPVLDHIYAVSMKIVGFAMKIAPLAVFALVFNSAFKFGPQVFLSLLGYVLLVVVGLAIQQFGVYSLLLKFRTQLSPLDFFRRGREVFLYAFSTASSNATLPKALSFAEDDLKLPRETSRFVLTVGSTANQNGTALFEGITVLFLAQVYGIDLSISQQVLVVLMSILAGIGTAGVPGGSLPLIMILLQQVGIPPEGIGLVLGVDRFLDMCRTTVNVTGDLVIASVIGSKPAGAKSHKR